MYTDGYVELIASGYTPLFEICGPSNRIVLNYDSDFLAPLGYIHNASGDYYPYEGAEPRDMNSLLLDLSRSNAEGWVVWKSNREAVKLKQADYVELHRFISNLTEKEVWRQLRAGTYQGYLEHLPDELQELAESWVDDLRDGFLWKHLDAERYENGVRHLGGTRKDQALWIAANVPADDRGLVFGLLDGKDISDSIWKKLEPKGVAL
jgi:RNA ligase